MAAVGQDIQSGQSRDFSAGTAQMRGRDAQLSGIMFDTDRIAKIPLDQGSIGFG